MNYYKKTGVSPKPSLNSEPVDCTIIQPKEYSLLGEDTLSSRTLIVNNVQRKHIFLDLPDDKKGERNKRIPNPYSWKVKRMKFIVRFIWWIISLCGTFTLLYRRFLSTIFTSLYFVASGMILNAKDLTSTSSDLWADFFYHLFHVLGIIISVAALCEALVLIEYYGIRGFYNTRRIVGRLRFNIIEAQVATENPYATSFAWQYDSDTDDPDVAYYYFSTQKQKPLFWFTQKNILQNEYL
jgi:hypothetical protein